MEYKYTVGEEVIITDKDSKGNKESFTATIERHVTTNPNFPFDHIPMTKPVYDIRITEEGHRLNGHVLIMGEKHITKEGM